MKEEKPFKFTPENLLENIKILGPWSQYHLATIALEAWFPDEYDEDGNCIGDTGREAELLLSLGMQYWADAVEKYHKETGYTANQLESECVNEY